MSATAPLPDAGPSNWVDRHAPERLKPWLKLGRFDRPIGTWLLLLPGWQGIALALAQYDRAFGLYELWLVVGFAIGAALMRGAGCAVNDIADRDFDAKVARTAMRPIPAGLISVKQALAFVAGLSLISLLILLTMNLTAVLLGALSLGLVAAYPFMKRITWWPQAWLGLTFNWGALLGFAAATGGLFTFGWLYVLQVQVSGDSYWMAPSLKAPGHVALSALLLYAGGVFWTLGYDTIYALQDIEDDAMAGVKSSARRLGGKVRQGVAIFYVLAVLLAGAAGVAAGLGPLFWIGVAAYALHLGWQVRRLDPTDTAGCLRLFKSNREAGLILLAAIALGALV
ncbi:MAG: 4-hydroxybenzoate octaprenyltransferase [Brevundimonas sp.]|uniref:UbiA family prenyltransferase n=1 Tax=Brevundimonas sp. TaxID=1871086 RepID=UPI0011FD5530|nr:UbiA family prenyltransferase [Brevundimonas sp.]RZJ19371.1 MAG: 4-hydroxybenzoate octaprenyltransferase [Brevundimonas sp.]